MIYWKSCCDKNTRVNFIVLRFTRKNVYNLQNYDLVIFQRNSWKLYAYTIAIITWFFALTKIFTKILKISINPGYSNIVILGIIFNKNEASFDVKKGKIKWIFFREQQDVHSWGERLGLSNKVIRVRTLYRTRMYTYMYREALKVPTEH